MQDRDDLIASLAQRVGDLEKMIVAQRDYIEALISVNNAALTCIVELGGSVSDSMRIHMGES